MAEYPSSQSQYKHTRRKSTNYYPQTAKAAFDHEISLDRFSSASFDRPLEDRCSFKEQSDKRAAAAFPLSSSLAPTHKTFGRCSELQGTDKQEEGRCLFMLLERNCVSDHRAVIGGVSAEGPVSLGRPRRFRNICHGSWQRLASDASQRPCLHSSRLWRQMKWF